MSQTKFMVGDVVVLRNVSMNRPKDHFKDSEFWKFLASRNSFTVREILDECVGLEGNENDWYDYTRFEIPKSHIVSSLLRDL